MELQQVIAEFIVHNQAEKAVSPLTVSALKSDLRCFLSYWRALNLPDDISACTTRTVRQCVAAMYKERNYKASTMNRKVDTLRSFFRFAVEQGYLADNPMDKIRAPRPDQALPTYYSGPKKSDQKMTKAKLQSRHEKTLLTRPQGKDRTGNAQRTAERH